MKKKKNRQGPRKCAVYQMSLIKRAKLAKLGRDDLRVGQPHPEYDQLQFSGYSKTGSEMWRTLSELENESTRMARYKTSKQKASVKANALKRKKHSEALDEEAEKLAQYHAVRGMSRKSFRKLKQSIQRRLLEMHPDIVWKNDADEVARTEKVLEEMHAANEKRHAERVLKMQADMEVFRERSRQIYESLKIAENVVPLDDFNVRPERSPLTQEQLNEMSNSRYEMPRECLSNYAQLEEDMPDLNY